MILKNLSKSSQKSKGLDVNFIDETVWLSQPQMAELFKTSRTNIVEHIGNIYDEGELDKNSTCRKSRQVRKEGKAISKGYVEYAGDELDRIIPPTSRRQGAREKKKESVLEKIRKIVEVFVGI